MEELVNLLERLGVKQIVSELSPNKHISKELNMVQVLN